MHLSPAAQKGYDAYKRAFQTISQAEWTAIDLWLRSFFDYQLEWLLDPYRFSISVKSRQIGASHTYAAAAVLWAMLGETTSVVSKGEREGEEVVAKALVHARGLEKLGSRLAKPPPKSAVGRLNFPSSPNGQGRIIALPATSGGRGYTGNMILDEFAYHTNPKQVYDGASGSILHGGKMRIISTPNGTGNEFHRFWNKSQPGWSKHAVKLEEAIKQGLFPRDEIPARMKECWDLAFGDQRIFDQLYNCSFLDNALQYIPTELINQALVEGTAVQGECYAGLDIGRKNDLTVLIVVCVDALGTRWVIHEETCKRTAFTDLDRLVGNAIRRWGCRKIVVDETGMGMFPAEQLQSKYGIYRVVPYTFTQKSKAALATTAYQHFADGRIKLPARNQALQADIAAIRRNVSDNGNVSYDGLTTEDGHQDRFWALAMALIGCSGPDHRRHQLFDHDPDA